MDDNYFTTTANHSMTYGDVVRYDQQGVSKHNGEISLLKPLFIVETIHPPFRDAACSGDTVIIRQLSSGIIIKVPGAHFLLGEYYTLDENGDYVKYLFPLETISQIIPLFQAHDSYSLEFLGFVNTDVFSFGHDELPPKAWFMERLIKEDLSDWKKIPGSDLVF